MYNKYAYKITDVPEKNSSENIPTSFISYRLFIPKKKMEKLRRI